MFTNAFNDPFFTSRPSSFFSNMEVESPFKDSFFTQPLIQPSSSTPAASSAPVASSSIPSQHYYHDHGFHGGLLNRMERFMDRMENGGAHFTPDQNGQFYSSSSYSSSHSSSDNKAPVSISSKSERRQVGNLIEAKSSWKDSQGNEKTVERRQIGEKTHEVVEEKNGKGEKRVHQNLKQIEPEKVDEFHKQWETEKLKLHGTSNANAALPAAEQKKLH